MNFKIEIIDSKAKLKNSTTSQNFVSVQAAIDEAKRMGYNIVNKEILSEYFRNKLEG